MSLDDETVCCDAAADHCRCVLPDGHDGPHVCDTGCGGSWSGDIDGEDFKIRALPTAVFGAGIIRP